MVRGGGTAPLAASASWTGLVKSCGRRGSETPDATAAVFRRGSANSYQHVNAGGPTRHRRRAESDRHLFTQRRGESGAQRNPQRPRQVRRRRRFGPWRLTPRRRIARRAPAYDSRVTTGECRSQRRLAAGVPIERLSKILPRYLERAEPPGEHEITRVAGPVLDVRHVVLRDPGCEPEPLLGQSGVLSQAAEGVPQAYTIRVVARSVLHGDEVSRERAGGRPTIRVLSIRLGQSGRDASCRWADASRLWSW
jgi:hypothetical protein